MQRLTLSKISSHLYHSKTHPEVQNEIWGVLYKFGLHPKTEILHQFSEGTERVIKDVALILEAKERAINEQIKRKK